MNKSVNWSALTTPLDVMNIDVPQTYLRRWLEFTPHPQGVTLHAELANGRRAMFRVEVVSPNIIRVRLTAADFAARPADLLLPDVESRPAPPFDLTATGDCLTLTTARLRVEFHRFPWHMQVFDRSLPPGAQPFFSQRTNDRAYGPAFEVLPPGFDQDAAGAFTVRESVAVTPGERFYGFGEKYTALNKWNQELTSWAVDSGNVSSYRSYKNVPFFMSSAGYGLFVHTTCPIIYRMGSESTISYSLHVAEPELDYFLIHGPDFKSILKNYTDLTGRAPLPPQWSFGFWISRCGYKSRAEVETVIRDMRAQGFPCDVISLDPWWMGPPPWSTYEWHTEWFPQPAEMIAALRQQGVRTCLWIHPYVPAGTPIYREALERGCLVSQANGLPSPVTEAFSGTDLFAVDFTHPQAARWFQEKLARLLDMGVAVFKTDFGEQAPVDAVYYNGHTGHEMHNLYPLLYNQTVFELTQRYFGRGLTWGRSGYAGSQRYPVQWGGDSYSSLDQMAGQLRGLLSYGLSGVPFCSHDVGGFDYSPEAFDHPTQDDFPKDAVTYVRWLQFGVFSSHLRAHGKQPREPWTYGDKVADIARRYLELRYRLLPYIYSQAARCTQTGLPLVKALLLEYPDDPHTHHLDQQYLFGDDFLVAPVLRPDNRAHVYLPPGQWVNYWDKSARPGGQWLTVTAPLAQIPVWVRAGAIIPMGPAMDYVGQKSLNPLTLELYLPTGTNRTVIKQEDAPDIAVDYTAVPGALEITLDPAPGMVELVVYGQIFENALWNNAPLPVETAAHETRVRFNGQAGGRVRLGSTH